MNCRMLHAPVTATAGAASAPPAAASAGCCAAAASPPSAVAPAVPAVPAVPEARASTTRCTSASKLAAAAACLACRSRARRATVPASPKSDSTVSAGFSPAPGGGGARSYPPSSPSSPAAAAWPAASGVPPPLAAALAEAPGTGTGAAAGRAPLNSSPSGHEEGKGPPLPGASPTSSGLHTEMEAEMEAGGCKLKMKAWECRDPVLACQFGAPVLRPWGCEGLRGVREGAGVGQLCALLHGGRRRRVRLAGNEQVAAGDLQTCRLTGHACAEQNQPSPTRAAGAPGPPPPPAGQVVGQGAVLSIVWICSAGAVKRPATSPAGLCP